MDCSIGKNACLILTDEVDRLYFSGEAVAEGVLIVSDKEKAYFTDMRYFEAAEKKFLRKGVNVYRLNEGAIKAYIEENRFKSVGLNYDKVTVKNFAEYKKLKVRLFDCESVVSSARSVKTEQEIENVRRACEITQKAFYKSLSFLKEGVTEKEFRDKLVSLFIKFGAEKESFDTIVAFGEGSSVPHYETGDVKLKRNSVVLIDTGCVVNGYCSDYTRTLYFGEPDEEFLNVYKAVKTANEYTENKITEGMPLKQADAYAREILRKSGYGENFTHSLGHGVGLQIHEQPYLSQKSDGAFSEGNVFTIEPGAYFYGKFGVRIEDTLVIKNGKAQRLFTDDKDLIII